jgi:hypothetical protein
LDFIFLKSLSSKNQSSSWTMTPLITKYGFGRFLDGFGGVLDSSTKQKYIKLLQYGSFDRGIDSPNTKLSSHTPPVRLFAGPKIAPGPPGGERAGGHPLPLRKGIRAQPSTKPPAVRPASRQRR